MWSADNVPLTCLPSGFVIVRSPIVPDATVTDTGAVGEMSSAPNVGDAVITATGLGAALVELDELAAGASSAPCPPAATAAAWVSVLPPVLPEQAATARSSPPRAIVVTIRRRAGGRVVIIRSSGGVQGGAGVVVLRLPQTRGEATAFIRSRIMAPARSDGRESPIRSTVRSDGLRRADHVTIGRPRVVNGPVDRACDQPHPRTMKRPGPAAAGPGRVPFQYSEVSG